MCFFSLGNESTKLFLNWKQQECESCFSKMDMGQKSPCYRCDSDDKKAYGVGMEAVFQTAREGVSPAWVDGVPGRGRWKSGRQAVGLTSGVQPQTPRAAKDRSSLCLPQSCDPTYNTSHIYRTVLCTCHYP